MIQFDVTTDGDDRDLHFRGQHVGTIERGRAMTDLRSTWVEWRFVPADLAAPAGEVRTSISAAYDDARTHTAALVTA